ncbi:amidohydrolase family protein [Ramlibacter sp. 2FC]|uniref:amidohydrolase family protein n=1 Tax=Ramlibacter sp. 2FC TaxID=2502188 RepID=UPI0010F56381|nr:amidohydrolase family protein [Ramlibacter sp. 2FC]
MNQELWRQPLSAPELLLAPRWTLLPEGPQAGWAVHVAGGRFAAVGPAEELARSLPHLQAFDLPQTLLMPGFVDAHHHLTQSFGKALAFGEPSEIFKRIWVPLESSLDERALHVAAKLAALEALRGGFTTVCDAGTRAQSGLEAIARATEEAGLRCVLGLSCNDLGSDQPPEAILARAERFLSAWPADGLVHPSLAIPIAEAASDPMLREVSQLAARHGAVFQIHVNEHLASVERSLVARGLRPLEHLDRAGALGPQTLVAHATLLAPHELNLLRESGTAVSYNPVASAWKGNAVADATLMAALGIRFGLGTDGTRSDGFRLMDAAETAQRLTSGLANGDSSCGGGWLWLDRATRGGADAAGLGRVTGAIAPGLAADFLLVDLDVPEMRPSWDLSWELVRLAARDQIISVHVAGRLRLWRGWPVDWDGRALLAEVDAIAAASVAKAPIQKIHPSSRAHRTAMLARGWEPGPRQP